MTATPLPDSSRQTGAALGKGRIEGIVSFVIALLVAGAIIYGWRHRSDPWINPETGIGYALGFIGGSLMIILLAYPVRKRVRGNPRVGSVGFWFRFHMLLGLIGPLAILYHSRFSWGALNSAVALGAMLIVAGSGLIGRFLYGRVHRGYSGRKLEVRALREDIIALIDMMRAGGIDADAVAQYYQPFEQTTVHAGAGFWTSAKAVVGLGISSRLTKRRAQRVIKRMAAADPPRRAALLQGNAEFFEAVRRATEFAFYDRMLRLWHLLHLPLFILLVASAIMHIIAVHMY